MYCIAVALELSFGALQGHECGRYKAEATDGHSLESMRRFMFYHKRWAVHDDSRCKEQELVERIELRVQSLLAARGQPAEMRLAVRIEEALIRLVECRRILAHSYIFCYYAFGDDVKLNHGLSLAQVAIGQPLFEDFQQALESRLEILSALMDKVGNAGDVDADEVLAITKVRAGQCSAGQAAGRAHANASRAPRRMSAGAAATSSTLSATRSTSTLNASATSPLTSQKLRQHSTDRPHDFSLLFPGRLG
jgi:hypothetical protein